MEEKKIPGKNGEIYVSYEDRVSSESIVYFTRDLSKEGLQKAYKKIMSTLVGKIAVKVHTGEQHGPNIIPRSWVKYLFENELKGATIIETNTYYKGDRYTTEDHLKTLEVNGWTFAKCDIIDDKGVVNLPVNGGKWFKEMSIGKGVEDYDSLLVFTHFKGHTQGGFGGSNKNIGIGMADGRIGKGLIHTTPNQPNMWDIAKEELMERITESSKATIDYFKDKICYINVMRNMSVSCDCEGLSAEPVVTPDVGILASLDILAIDQACVDIIYSMNEKDGHALVHRIENRHGHRQLSYMKEMNMGNNKYVMIDLDNDERRMYPKDATVRLRPWKDDGQR